MRTTTIRALDYWLGVPACALLSGLRRLTGSTARTAPRETARQPRVAPAKILFLKFIEQGATVLAQDAIARATRAVGRDNVFFCVFESNRAILDVIGTVPAANIITIRDKALTTFVADFLKAAGAVRRHRIDTVIDMEFFSRASAIFAFLTGAAIRVGLHRFTGELPYRGNLMTHRVQYLPQVHIASQYSILVEASFNDPREEPMLKVPLDHIRSTSPHAPPAFAPTAAEIDGMRARLGSPRGPIAVLNPNASDLLPLRKWETSKFGDLATRILAAYPDALIVLTGAPSESAIADELCRSLGSTRVKSVAGQTSLRELLTLYTIADVLVTNDSGPGHFASLTPVHAIVLFGPETPRLFGSLAPSTTIIWKELACSPCVSVFNHRLSPCRNNVCMQSITVDEVFDAVQSAIRSRGLAAPKLESKL
ncbi:MAG TPA: glycosyltransferase family 9 protein [Vicinamibacterales bacterium]|nr:glycosyltransferase family 9 protein [Vicinamibacterales bacterium]